MKASLRLRLDQLCDRHEELTALLADVEVISDNKRFRKLSREHNDLTEITEVWGKYRQAEEDIETAEMMKSDPDFKDMAEEEIKEILYKICNVTEKYEQTCDVIVSEYFQMIYDLILQEYTPEVICKYLNFCTSEKIIFNQKKNSNYTLRFQPINQYCY